VDYNLRRRSQKFIASFAKMRAWRWFMRPRTLIERWFVWTKRHFALKYFQVQGREAIARHVLATLLVGWLGGNSILGLSLIAEFVALDAVKGLFKNANT